MFHHFAQDISNVPLPEKFTFPFHYQPHSLCIRASELVQKYLTSKSEWKDELEQGKMFGVLIVRNAAGEIGFLAAFSGNLAGRNTHSWFVPPVFDMLQPHEFFKTGETEISAINHRITQLESATDYLQLLQQLHEHSESADNLLKTAKGQLKADKKTRDEQREYCTDNAVLARLEQESRFQKAEFKRLERKIKEETGRIEAALKTFTDEIGALKQTRKTQSANLQQRLFDSFQFINLSGQSKGLCAIFADTVQKTPPAGAGECAAPKLLQFAFKEGLYPLAMAEFWWGASPKTEIRHHGHYYPACKGKCEPILGHMLAGLEVDENPFVQKNNALATPKLIYEDDDFIVVNKPAGMLSVPGKTGQLSVIEILAEKRQDSEPLLAVHRLDMHTSGLLLIAKSAIIHKQLQAMFRKRSVRKRYIALLAGTVEHESGEINLPLSPDYINRPRQMVDFVDGKTAITRWKVLQRTEGQTRVALYPLTGRTHQLRVHAAHPNGLNCAIAGDPLYGKSSTRLFLHAESLCFIHPRTGKEIEITVRAEF